MARISGLEQRHGVVAAILSDCRDADLGGETIVVAKGGKPWARLVPLEPGTPRRQPGVLAGRISLPPTEVLLDTHALLWWLAEPERLSAVAYAAIAEDSTRVFISAAAGLG